MLGPVLKTAVVMNTVDRIDIGVQCISPVSGKGRVKKHGLTPNNCSFFITALLSVHAAVRYAQ
ncbi:MAG: hypothetical protein D3910_27490 [Candidatus Electrothrix sp. ATG2]|nr:hypothetical protein [Candidatus Electrothrix sp. ATG2]